MIDLRFANLNGFKPIEELIDNELIELVQFNKTTRWTNVKNINEYKINEGSTPIIYSGNHSLERVV
ncbi:hypothetical protein S100390_v1c07510 [Spiroplasma sp. NBRC 100390]|nr:hypothetical protein STU14_v1c07510 [Spiroplasma sp. TU-14]APE13557.1 hypothetical protein S100390_v1c07510 [Spiroplasma sp. NBRC 100390]